MNTNKMNIIITGGAGFIGSHLCTFLIDQGHSVLCIDNLSSGNGKNLEKLIFHENFYFQETDVINIYKSKTLNYINKLFNGKVDQIYHLACPASPKFYQKNPINTINTCINGTQNILEIAKIYNSTVLFTSTSEIYGEPAEHPQTEEYRGNVNTIGIRACYDEGKRLAETLMMEYNRLYGINVKIVRIFNTYGPNMREDDGRVISNFVYQMKNNDDITIYGDGRQTRSLCYIDDMVEGLVLMMNSIEIGPINLGNPEEISIIDLVKTMLDIYPTKSIIKFCELPKDDPTKRCPDITKANILLKWKPKINLKDGLLRTINQS